MPPQNNIFVYIDYDFVFATFVNVYFLFTGPVPTTVSLPTEASSSHFARVQRNPTDSFRGKEVMLNFLVCFKTYHSEGFVFKNIS